MPQRTLWPRSPSALPPSMQLASSADKPLGWLRAALRRGRGERRTQEPASPPTLPTTAAPVLLYSVEATVPAPPPPSIPGQRRHPISLETAVPLPLSSPSRRTMPPPPLSSPGQRTTLQTPSSTSRRLNVEMLRGYDSSSEVVEADSIYLPSPPSTSARRAPWSCGLTWKRSVKVNPLELAGECLCAICLGELGPRSYTTKGETKEAEPPEQQQRLGCGHAFHATCMQEWLHTQWQKYGEMSCPMCRSPVLPPIVKAEPERLQPSMDGTLRDHGGDTIYQNFHPAFGEAAQNQYRWAF